MPPEGLTTGDRVAIDEDFRGVVAFVVGTTAYVDVTPHQHPDYPAEWVRCALPFADYDLHRLNLIPADGLTRYEDEDRPCP